MRSETRHGSASWEWVPPDWPTFLQEVEAIVAMSESRDDRLWLFRGHRQRDWLLDSTLVRSLKTDVRGMLATDRFSTSGGLTVEQRNDLIDCYFQKLCLAGPSAELLELAKKHDLDPHYEWLRRMQQHGEAPHPEIPFGPHYVRGTPFVDWSLRWDVGLFFANESRVGTEGALWIIDTTATGPTLHRKTPVIEIVKMMMDAVDFDSSLGTPLIVHPLVQTTYPRVERQEPVYVAQMEPVWDLGEVWAGLQDQPGYDQILLKLVLPAGTEHDCRRYLESRGLTHEYIYPDESQPVGATIR